MSTVRRKSQLFKPIRSKTKQTHNQRHLLLKQLPSAFAEHLLPVADLKTQKGRNKPAWTEPQKDVKADPLELKI
jgi:hypothetical protein